MIWWLASYPKSGNTWLRAVLDAIASGGEPSLSDLLPSGTVPNRRADFEDELGIFSSDLSPEHEWRLRPLATELRARRVPTKIYWKTHDALVPVSPGRLILPPAVTAGAIYLIRDPRDVVGSMAHHYGMTVDQAVDCLCDDDHWSPRRQRTGGGMPSFLGNWSFHVESWQAAPFPVHTIRYEDMHSDPQRTFGTVLRILGLTPAPGQIDAALDACRFETLRRREAESGFSEAIEGRPFFRSGRLGEWRRELTPAQACKILSKHKPVMAAYGYR